MKLLITLLISLSTGVFAQAEFDVAHVTIRSSMSVIDMKCVSPIANVNESYTELDHHFRKGYQSVELDHRAATTKGCDMENLKNLVSRAHQRFGYASVTVTIKKHTAKTPRIYNGKCMRYFKEQLELDLGNGIILETPFAAALKDDTNCQ